MFLIMPVLVSMILILLVEILKLYKIFSRHWNKCIVLSLRRAYLRDD